MTWGGLPSSVPVGYIGYFCLPAVIGAALGRRLNARFGWRRPITLLAVGLLVGFLFALIFNAGSSDDRLRAGDCRPNVVHTTPSRAMLGARAVHEWTAQVFKDTGSELYMGAGDREHD